MAGPGTYGAIQKECLCLFYPVFQLTVRQQSEIPGMVLWGGHQDYRFRNSGWSEVMISYPDFINKIFVRSSFLV
jgi:hypothetical protein